MFRVIYMFLFLSFVFSFQLAHACSCYCGYNETVSEYMQNKVVFWGVPKSSKVELDQSERRAFHLSTSIVVLEDYNQELTKTISIDSDPEDGGMCGFQPKVGIPQLITAYPKKEGYSGFSTCTCEIPPQQLFDYLENRIDVYIPDPSDCEGDIKPKECDVWENMDEYNDISWSKRIKYFPYSKHKEKLFPKK